MKTGTHTQVPVPMTPNFYKKIRHMILSNNALFLKKE